MQEHIKASGHVLCVCGGYWYPHRPGSPCCERNKLGAFNVCKREGVVGDDLTDVFIECCLSEWDVRKV